MQEGLKVLVVGSDAGHDISEVLSAFLTKGWTPQVVHMTVEEWMLANVGPHIDHMSALHYSAIPAAQRKLNEAARFAIAPNSNYFFHLHHVYSQLSDASNGDAEQITARTLLSSCFNDHTHPLMAVVLSEEALSWPRADEVWFRQLPTETLVYRMRPDGILIQVRFGAVAQS